MNVLSIKVAVTSVILLGLWIRGNIPKLNSMSTKCFGDKLLLHFNRSKLNPPHRNIDLCG